MILSLVVCSVFVVCVVELRHIKLSSHPERNNSGYMLFRIRYLNFLLFVLICVLQYVSIFCAFAAFGLAFFVFSCVEQYFYAVA